MNLQILTLSLIPVGSIIDTTDRATRATNEDDMVDHRALLLLGTSSTGGLVSAAITVHRRLV